MRISVGRVVLIVLAIVAVEAAVTFAAVPFTDVGVLCTSSITTAVHGRLVEEGSGGKVFPISKAEEAAEQDGLKGLSGVGPAQDTRFVCRSPARRRLALAAVGVGAVMLAIGATWRRLDPQPEPRILEEVPA